jgi:hypothetical protein
MSGFLGSIELSCVENEAGACSPQLVIPSLPPQAGEARNLLFIPEN